MPKLPSIFSDHMVLQRGMPVPVWGWAAAGAEVTVSIANQQAATVADAAGNWRVILPPIAGPGPHDLTITPGRGKPKIFRDVLIGDVWICGGQSNMAYGLAGAWGGKEALAAAKHPAMRLFKIKEHAAGEPQADCEGTWKICSPETAADFSAVGYFFGAEIQQALDVPIGLIHTAWSGTLAEGWTPEPALAAHTETRPIIETYHAALKDFPRKKIDYDKKLAEWQKLVRVMREADPHAAAMLPPPEQPMGPGHMFAPANNFNGVLHPIIPYAIKGVLWYQGEGNGLRGIQYRTLLPVMIDAWRAAWNRTGEDAFPFLIVQLPNYFSEDAPMPPAPDPNERPGWAEVREAQLLIAQHHPACHLAVAIDLGEPHNLHPGNKQPIGHRLALLALQRVYGKDVVGESPVLKGMKIKGRKCTLTFENIATGLTTREGAATGPLTGFAIAGADHQFTWGNASLEKNIVTITHPSIKKPIAVRYLWNAAPTASLYNSAGLPASPFRTDV